jgi:hypothetical protein
MNSDWPYRGDPTAHKQRMNEDVRRGLERSEAHERIPFVCECGRHDCFRTLWLEGIAYDSLRGDDRAKALVCDRCADVVPAVAV